MNSPEYKCNSYHLKKAVKKFSNRNLGIIMVLREGLNKTFHNKNEAGEGEK